MMTDERANLEDLFPAARELFAGRPPRPPAVTVTATVVAAGILVLLGARLLRWADRNL